MSTENDNGGNNDGANNNKKKLRVLTTEARGIPQAQKTVLPEVLPDPRRPSSLSSGPRARTLAHMQRLLATAAAVGVATVSCGKETKGPGEKRGCGSSNEPTGYSVVDELPPPAVVDASSGSTNVSANVDASAGYAVVDPMPTPAYCPGVAAAITPTARLAEQKGGAVHLVVTFSKAKGRDDFKYVKDAPVVGYGGTIVKNEVRPDGTATVTMKLDPGMAEAASPAVSVSIKGTCKQGPATLSASVSWTQPWKTKTPEVYLNEY